MTAHAGFVAREFNFSRVPVVAGFQYAFILRDPNSKIVPGGGFDALANETPLWGGSNCNGITRVTFNWFFEDYVVPA